MSNILIGCERSQVLADAFRRYGHFVISADIAALLGNSPSYFYQGDVFDLVAPCTFTCVDGTEYSVDRWDLVILHPPCTYLCKAGSRYLYPSGKFSFDRYRLGLEARSFFYRCLNFPAERVVVENPTPLRVYALPPPSTVVSPHTCGGDYAKRTLLWCRGVPPPMNAYAPYHAPPLVYHRSSFGRSRLDASLAAHLSEHFNFYLERCSHEY